MHFTLFSSKLALLFFSSQIILCLGNLTKNPCPLLENNNIKKGIWAHRGGNISRFHENSLAICKDAVRSGFAGVEMDLMRLSSGEIILYHDTNFEGRTGVNMNVEKSTWSQVKYLRYKYNYDGRNYDHTCSIALLLKVLEEICSINKSIGLWFDIKTFFNSAYASSLMEILEKSPCACDESQIIVVELYQQIPQMKYIKSLNSQYRCKVHAAFDFYEWQGDQGYAKLKSTIDKYVSEASFIDAHKSIWSRYPALQNDLNKRGICTAVWGGEGLTAERNPLNPINLVLDDVVWDPLYVLPQGEDDCELYSGDNAEPFLSSASLPMFYASFLKYGVILLFLLFI